jgi:TPR repeat protein
LGSSRNNGNAGNAEVVALLNLIGERLVRKEQEHNQMKEAIENLEDKSTQSEQFYLKIQSKIDNANSNEKELEIKQKELEKSQKQILKKIEQTEKLSDRLEETITQQNKLVRRLENIVQDRARMLRKLERIEEAVLDTQNALEAKAMVLLTDQNVAEQSSLPQVTASKNIQKQENDKANDNQTFWQHPATLKIASVFFLVIVALLSGIFISRMGAPVSSPDQNISVRQLATAESEQKIRTEPIYEDKRTENVSKIFPEDIAESDNYQPIQEDKNTADVKPFVGAVEKEVGESVPDGYEEEDEQISAEIDTASLDKEMQDNPQSVAKQLNTIAPTAGAPENMETTGAAGTEETENNIKKAAFTSSRPAAFDTRTFIDSQRSTQPVSEILSPDENLPPVAQQVELKAFQNVPEAQHDIGAIYTAGHAGVEINYERAAIWFKQAAVNGVANARYNLGVLYHQGIGVEQNTPLAINWYKSAAELGHPEAQYNLGIAYIEGIGVGYDPEKAAYYFEQAARLGIMEAAYNLGLIYENGLLGQPKPEEALYWYKAASDKGSPEARDAMELLAKNMGIDLGQVERIFASVQEVEKAIQQGKEPSVATNTSGQDEIPDQVIKAIPKLSMSDLEGPDGSFINHESENSQQAVIAQIQEQLMSIGLYPGPADGSYNPVLEDSIRSYQQKNGLATTGLASEGLLKHLLSREEEFGSRE